MVTVTKEQFIGLCEQEDCFRVIKWPWLHQRLPLSELICMYKNAGVDAYDLQYIIWKFDNP